MKKSTLVGYVAALALLLNCAHNPPDAQDEPPLRTVAPFPFGAALSPTRLTTGTPLYRQTAEREFSSVTAENHLKMHHVHPAQDRYDWSGSDVIVNFAEQSKKRMHGHTLLWHEAVPNWVKSFSGDSVAWENLFKTHVQTVVGKYRGRIASWDVVNEAFDDKGELRNSIWREKLGPDFIARAFRYAREADPAVKLFYNDYGQEYSPAKLRAMLRMVEDFRRRGVPIDGIGLQFHINVNTSETGITDALRQSAATGLLVHISELDVAMNPAKATNFQPTPDLLNRQKLKFQFVVKTYRDIVPKAQQHGITTWNVGDADSWIPGFCKCSDYPLPFDVNYQKKPAYDGIVAGLR